MKNKIIYGLGLAAIIVITAMTASYITKENIDANAQTYGQPASMQTKTTTTKNTNNSMPWKQAQPSSGSNSAMPWKNQNTANTQQQIQQPVQQQQAQPCNDNNVVGTLLGGVAGGLVGNGIGKGSGKTVATIAGAAGGAYMGNQLIPTQGVACK